jgi:hypothetical protein
MAAAVLAAAISGCNDAADDRPGTTGDTSASAGATAVDPRGAAPAGQAGADDGVVMDSIPLRTPEGKPARFGRRSGHLVYRYTGDVVGIREVWFDQWGMRERRFDSSSPAAGRPGVPQNNLVVSAPEGFSAIDMRTKTGMRMQNPSDDEYLASDSGKIFSLGEMIFRHSGGRRLADTTIRGLKVSVLQLDQGQASTKVYVWQGIVMRELFKSQDGTSFGVEIESMDFDIDVPVSLFAVPAGVKLTDAPPPGSQPGAAQGGAMPPGGAPPGAMPPGAMPPGAMPPGAMPPGTMPPGPGSPPLPGGR